MGLALGSTIRIGNHLDSTDLPMRVRPSFSGSGSFDDVTGFGWYAFLGASASAVAYNYLLTGRTPYPSNVTLNNLIADAQVGIALRFGRLQITGSYVGRTKEVDPQRSIDRWGAISASWHF